MKSSTATYLRGISPGHRGIHIARARVCTVCWTVHENDECPECRARQWIRLHDLLKDALFQEESKHLPMAV